MSGRLNPPEVIAAGGSAYSKLWEVCIDAYRNGIEPGSSACEARARGELDPPHVYTAEQISAPLNNKGETSRISLGDIYTLALAPGPSVAEARH